MFKQMSGRYELKSWFQILQSIMLQCQLTLHKHKRTEKTLMTENLLKGFQISAK